MSVHPDCALGERPHDPHRLSSGNTVDLGPLCDGVSHLSIDDFPIEYRDEMLRAYPVIARMTQRERYRATAREQDLAFQRILDAKNLRRVHELYLQAQREQVR